MKKIALIGLFIASNAVAQLNLGAVLSGQTNEVICYVFCAPGDPGTFQKIVCDNKAGITGGYLNLGQQANPSAIMAGFVGSGKWNLATSYIGKNNVTTFLFTKK